ncbi:MAG: DUF5908 family protein [Bacteroidota bacterium]
MAVEVKQIVIRAVLTEEEKQHNALAGYAVEKDALVRETVNEVLKILKKKNRR